nr:MAG TPA: hypothetical protein [Caudoviricetes sp.]
MKYKLLKDLPFAKAGEVFERVTHKSEDGLSDYDYLKIRKREADGEDETCFGVRYNYFLNNFDEWFEEITDSIHWKPVIGEEYWSFYSDGGISHNVCTGSYWDTARYEMGRTYRTEEDCIRVRDRELAKARLRRTSTFKPDFENGNGGYVIFYNPEEEKLETHNVYCYDYGEIVRYETIEEAEKSIRENREDWKIYFGIKEKK